MRLTQATPEYRTHNQQNQWYQVNLPDPPEDRTIGDCDNYFIPYDRVNLITDFELTRLAAKQTGQLARSATLAVTMTAAIGGVGTNHGILAIHFDNDSARFEHIICRYTGQSQKP